MQYGFIMLKPGNLSHQDAPRFPSMERGAIYDRNGRLLAIQTRLDSVTAWIPEIEDRETTARLLGDALDWMRVSF